MIDRGIAAVITVGFLAIVRPDPNPKLWGVALTAVMMYEVVLFSIRYIRRLHRVNERIEQISRGDIKRWSETIIGWPMREVENG